MNDNPDFVNISLDTEIKQIFERLGPDDDAQKRMLETILASIPDPEPQPVKKRSVWKTVLPLAASFALLAGIGLFALMGIIPNSAENSVNESDTLSASSEDRSYTDQETGSGGGSANIEPSEDTSDEKAFSYPYVESSSLGTLVIVDEKAGGSLTLDRNLVGAALEDAPARTETGSQTILCTIYAYGFSDSGYYAVRYEGDSSYYLFAPA